MTRRQLEYWNSGILEYWAAGRAFPLFRHSSIPSFQGIPLPRSLAIVCLLIFCAGMAYGRDWPTYMHDNSRSGVTQTQLELPLRPVWTFRPLRPPAPAWPGPARQDFYHRHYDLRPLETYDCAFHATAANGAVYFGSSAQDKIYALDAASGRIRWTFLTEGPVRFAPTLSGGRVYAGSDDGHVYCLSGRNGALVWKKRIAPDKRLVPGNGRMISLWPVRTGLVVEAGTVYATAGLFPEEGTYLAALDARTGEFKYCQQIMVAPQGYALASSTRLYLPTGRTSPAIFTRAEGTADGQLPSAGGAYALLTDEVLVTGPGRGPKELQAGDLQTKDAIATFGGLRMVVAGSVAYLQSERQVSAFDRGRYLQLSRQRVPLQRKREALKKSLSKMAGAEAEEANRQIEDLNTRIGTLDAAMKACYLWTTEGSYPYAMIVAGKMLLLGGGNEVAAVDCENGTVVWKGRVEGRAYGLAVAQQSLYVSTDTGRIHCFRHAEGGMPSIVAERTRADPYPRDRMTQRYKAAADYILGQTSSPEGFGLVLECGDGRLACELARRSRLQIIAVDTDAGNVDTARRLVNTAGLHGRVTVHHLTGDRLPYTSYFANVIVWEGVLRDGQYPGNPKELLRLLRPHGGVLLLGAPADARDTVHAWGQADWPPWRVVADSDLVWGSLRRGPLDGAGEWTHQYAEPGNSACSGDTLIQGKLTVQWFGEPGPREMIDRHHRNVTPLAKDGRLFVPGDCVVFAVDAYNGTMLWRADVPNSRRLGAFLDAGSMAVDDRALYLAAADKCHSFDVQNGQPQTVFAMPQLVADDPHVWGYVAYEGSLLFGSGCKKEAFYTETSYAADIALWRRDMKLVTSDYLFAKDKRDDRLLWTYRGGVILNTTITAAAARVFFVETHSPAALADKTGRLPVKTLFSGGEQYLVALDQQTGRTVFKKKIDVGHFEEPVYLGYGQGVLLLSGSRLDGKCVRYSYDAYDAQTAAQLWHANHDSGLPTDGEHGEYNRQPTLIGDVAYAWPYAYALRTGRRVEDWKFERRGHGCGSISASAQCLFWRGGNPWMHELGPQGGPTRLNTVSRPGCWINMIPAGGLVLIPEASSGCTCGFSLQASLAYIPRSALE
ncbi:MAG: methyltransferase domain-containing protein [Planctomycetes bacterium]|nr:methyltransferase domain-containing protein [Planctomycetota bacterium]